MPSISPLAAVERVMPLLGEAFDPAWMRGTWEGAHGRAGLTGAVDTIERVVTLGTEHADVMATVDGRVVRPRDGSSIGTFTNYIVQRTGEGVTIDHGVLALTDAAQGTGFGRAAAAHALGRYPAAGVDAVTLDAGKSVGGLAWAPMFEFDARGVAATVIAETRATEGARLLRTALDRGTISAAEFQQLAPTSFESPRQILALGEVGKRILLGQSWAGVLELRAPGVSQELRPLLGSALPAGWDPARASAHLASAAMPEGIQLRPITSESFTVVGESADELALMAEIPFTVHDARTGDLGRASVQLDAAANGVVEPFVDVQLDGDTRLAHAIGDALHESAGKLVLT